MHKDIKYEWEKRAICAGEKLNGVLLKNLPEKLNLYIHERQIDIIYRFILSDIKQYVTVLDLCCGYGRISKELKKNDHVNHIVGVDFSEVYCRSFKKHIGDSVICANLNSLPFQDESFDLIIGVTALMYVDQRDIPVIMKSLYNCLKKNGKIFLIDPGFEYLWIVNLVRRNSSGKTSGRGFFYQEYKNLGEDFYLDCEKIGGITAFSLAIPIALLLLKIGVRIDFLLKICSFFDSFFKVPPFFSLHRWMILRKD